MPRRSLARSLAVRFVCCKWSAHSRARHVVERATVLFICMDGVRVRWEYINDKDNLVPRVLSYSSLRSEREKVTDNPGIRIKRQSDGSMRPFTRSVFLRLGKPSQVPRLHHEPFYRGFPCQYASVNVARVAYHLHPTPFLVFYATPILPSLG